MSRGLGARQRAILAEVERDGQAVITRPDMTEAERVARRRAARRLEDLGLVTLAAHYPRVGAYRRRGNCHVVAHPPGSVVPRGYATDDGRVVLRPNGPPMPQGRPARLAEVRAEDAALERGDPEALERRRRALAALEARLADDDG